MPKQWMPWVVLVLILAAAGIVCWELPFELPGMGNQGGLKTAWGIYEDNYGNTWVVPDGLTIVYTAVFPDHVPPEIASLAPAWSHESTLGHLVGAIVLGSQRRRSTCLRSMRFIQLQFWP